MSRRTGSYGLLVPRSKTFGSLAWQPARVLRHGRQVSLRSDRYSPLRRYDCLQALSKGHREFMSASPAFPAPPAPSYLASVNACHVGELMGQPTATGLRVLSQRIGISRSDSRLRYSVSYSVALAP